MFRPSLISLAALVACNPAETDPAESDATPPPDLVAWPDAGQARAGFVTDDAALVAGLAAEGVPGDVVMVNDRARFVIQGLRDGSYYVTGWGGLLDADVRRDPGEPGADLVEKWLPMTGLGRVIDPLSLEVVADGTGGGPAIVKVEGSDIGLPLIEGAAESPGLLAPLGLQIVQTWTLHPDTPFLEVETTVTAPEGAELAIADVMFGSPETGLRFTEGVGFADDRQATYGWTGAVGRDDDVAVGTFADAPDGLEPGSLDLIAELVDITVGGGAPATIPPGGSLTWRRHQGVARTLAALTDRWLADRGIASTPFTGTVTAPDGPVAGARVHLLVDGAPWTVTDTGPDGSFAAQVPAGADVRAVAVGEHTGLFVDRPLAPQVAPYAAAGVRDRTLDAVRANAPRPAVVEGRGIGADAAPLSLSTPAQVTVAVDDGLPFTAQLRPLDAPTARDPRLSRPIAGDRAVGWSRGGPLTLTVPAGRHALVVHRGIRHEAHAETLELDAGAAVTVSTSLASAYTPEGWLVADPHSHASPSGDGAIPMEDRLIVAAAQGVQIHVGTDHDHLADYRPLVDALGLSAVLASVVSDEVSPPLRGHMNIYPVEPTPGASNGGAWSWWDDIPATTDAIVDALRARHGDRFVLQLNHPQRSGVASSAGWSQGRIRRADFWTTRFDAVEVLNSASTSNGLDFWLDAVARGLRPTPTGVSDSHGHLSGHVGLSVTFVRLPGVTPGAFDDDAFADAMRAGAVVVSRGPFLDTSAVPGMDVAAGTTLTVTARGPSWIVVDRLILLRDGEEVARITGDTGTFDLSPDRDAVYVVIAEGDAAMAPVSDRTPWALAGPWRVDVGGDGWTPPKPAFEVGR